jgi:FixJ family two-component response regulator
MTTSSSPIVFIVDDDEDMRLSMRRLLKTVGLRAELFATAPEFMERNIPDAPSCVVLDVRLPGMGGLEVQQKLIESGINIPMSVKAMKSGAFEFLTKPFRHQEFLDAVQQALQRDQLSRHLRNQIAGLQERYKSLTAREQKVMDLVVSGMQTKQIASVLGTSEITAAVHRGRVMHKMQAGSPAELGSMAERLKFTPNR